MNTMCRLMLRDRGKTHILLVLLCFSFVANIILGQCLIRQRLQYQEDVHRFLSSTGASVLRIQQSTEILLGSNEDLEARQAAVTNLWFDAEKFYQLSLSAAGSLRHTGLFRTRSFLFSENELIISAQRLRDDIHHHLESYRVGDPLTLEQKTFLSALRKGTTVFYAVLCNEDGTIRAEAHDPQTFYDEFRTFISAVS